MIVWGKAKKQFYNVPWLFQPAQQLGRPPYSAPTWRAVANELGGGGPAMRAGVSGGAEGITSVLSTPEIHINY